METKTKIIIKVELLNAKCFTGIISIKRTYIILSGSLTATTITNQFTLSLSLSPLLVLTPPLP